MISSEPESMPEKVIFNIPIKVLNGEKVESFLTKIQRGMINTLKEITYTCYKKFDHEQSGFKNWLMANYPSQCIIVV
jgi:hypothetical protein